MKDLDFSKIGKKIKETRISKHLTQEYIANAVDVNTSHISNIENNRVKVSLSTLVQICNALDTTVDYILADEYDRPSSVIEQEILHQAQLCTPETQKTEPPLYSSTRYAILKTQEEQPPQSGWPRKNNFIELPLLRSPKFRGGFLCLLHYLINVNTNVSNARMNIPKANHLFLDFLPLPCYTNFRRRPV